MDRMKNQESYGDDRMRMIIPYAHMQTVCELPIYGLVDIHHELRIAGPARDFLKSYSDGEGLGSVVFASLKQLPVLSLQLRVVGVQLLMGGLQLVMSGAQLVMGGLQLSVLLTHGLQIGSELLCHFTGKLNDRVRFRAALDRRYDVVVHGLILIAINHHVQSGVCQRRSHGCSSSQEFWRCAQNSLGKYVVTSLPNPTDTAVRCITRSIETMIFHEQVQLSCLFAISQLVHHSDPRNFCAPAMSAHTIYLRAPTGATAPVLGTLELTESDFLVREKAFGARPRSSRAVHAHPANHANHADHVNHAISRPDPNTALDYLGRDANRALFVTATTFHPNILPAMLHTFGVEDARNAEALAFAHSCSERATMSVIASLPSMQRPVVSGGGGGGGGGSGGGGGGLEDKFINIEPLLNACGTSWKEAIKDPSFRKILREGAHRAGKPINELVFRT